MYMISVRRPTTLASMLLFFVLVVSPALAAPPTDSADLNQPVVKEEKEDTGKHVKVRAYVANREDGKVIELPIKASHAILNRETLPNGLEQLVVRTDGRVSVAFDPTLQKLDEPDVTRGVTTSISMTYTVTTDGQYEYYDINSIWGSWNRADPTISLSGAYTYMTQYDLCLHECADLQTPVGVPTLGYQYTTVAPVYWEPVWTHCPGCFIGAKTEVVLKRGSSEWDLWVGVTEGDPVIEW